MGNFLKGLFASSNDRTIRSLQKEVARIEALEPQMQQLSDAQMRAHTRTLQERARKGEPLDDLLYEAFALVREAAVRTVGMRHYPVQLLGGIVLHQGRIAEMRTGEGKTLVATLPSFLNALCGKGVHIVTVNDYLARRDAQWMGKIHRFLGLSVGTILHDMDARERQEAYNCDIIYATNNELGFDYLRDNMAVFRRDMVQRELHYAIVDEVDSILIDEARTPLIISGAGDKSTDIYRRADRFVARLHAEEDYVSDEKQKTVNLTEVGVRRAEQHFGVENMTDINNTELLHSVNQALRAHVLMKRDRDYVVQNGEVLIVDEFTGRLMIGRRYSDGLHQAIEAKENVNVQRESKTLATITFQNYFRMYKKLSGMTGTAKTEEDEFRGIYNLDVVTIPTHKPMIRLDQNDAIYRSEQGKYGAVIEEIVQRHALGQPILVGTVSVEKSELLSKMLTKRGVKHQVLNAKFHEKEAQIVAQAGQYGAITIATNMAGRGTDILLGGNPEYMARQQMEKQGYDLQMIEDATSHAETDDADIIAARKVYNDLYQGFKIKTDEEHERVVAAGGLHIIGTERHESRRIDNQLRGRAGRQGDPGSSRFYIALEDDIMRLFGSERIMNMVDKLGMDDEMKLEYGMLSKQIESAQKRVEARNFDIRKNVLQYDDVMNQQRNIIYSQRRKVLFEEDMRGAIVDMMHTLMEQAVDQYIGTSKNPEEWDIKGLLAYCSRYFNTAGLVDVDDAYAVESLDKGKLKAQIDARIEAAYADKEEEITQKGVDMREVERIVLLHSVDAHWMDHIDAMDQLRQGIGLRAYGNRDPVVEYKFEGFEMFDEMIRAIQEQTLITLMHISVEQKMERRQVAQPTRAGLAGEGEDGAKKPVRTEKKVGRNDPCPCGSGKKYKHCCGRDV
nr:preprotein translocase subunit SecA [Maliibacterium massiliense]